MESNNNLVFVYGTLKKGEPNHYLLDKPNQGSAELISTAITVDKWPLVIYSQYNIPFLLDKIGTGKRIHGEIYRVDDKVLKELDDLEAHPDYYLRTLIDVNLIKNEKEAETIQVWSYLLPNFKPEMLESDFLDNYSTYGDHGKQYVERLKRSKEVSVINEVKISLQ